MDRVSAARARLSGVKSELAELGQPCVHCHWYELACTHPSVAKVTIDPVTRNAGVTAISANDARSETGGCGPEGALFDSRSAPAVVFVDLVRSSAGRWCLALVAFVGYYAIFG